MLKLPLSYSSLKAVLLYMDVNMRFTLSRRSSSIQTASKSTPLKAEKLSFFSSYGFRIGTTSFNLGVYRHYKNTRVPSCIQWENDRGGIQYDLDKFGIQDVSMELVHFPEDIVIGNGYETAFRIQEEADQLRYVAMLTHSSEVDLSRGLKSSEEHDIYIRDLQDSLLPYHYRRQNVSDPCQSFIQLTIHSLEGTSVERVKYNKSLPEAIRYISSIIFGKMCETIQARRLEINGENMIIRLPSGFRMKYQELKLPGKLPDRLMPQLNSLELTGKLRAEDFEHPVVKTVKKIYLRSYLSNGRWLQIVQKLTNEEIHLRARSFQFSVHDHMILIRSWIEKQTTPGAKFVLETEEENRASKMFELIGYIYGVSASDKRKVVIPISEVLHLEVSFTHSQEKDYFWSVKMEVMASII